jgi:hypothetical protein
MPLGGFKLNGIGRRRAVLARTASTISSGSFSASTPGVFSNSASGNFVISLPSGVQIGDGQPGTIEFRLRVTSIEQQTIFSNAGTTQTTGLQLMGNTGNGPRIRLANSNTSGGEYAGAEWDVSTNTFYTFALTTSGNNTWFHHWNGTRRTPGFSYSGSVTSWRFTNTMGARFDEIRFSKIARYSASYTPATSSFVNDADTLGLFHCDSNSQADDTA